MKTLIVLSIAMILIACSNSSVADTGSGTNIGNAAIGIILTNDKKPAAGVVVSFIPENRENSSAPLPDSLKDTTGVDGRYFIQCGNQRGTIVAETSLGNEAVMSPGNAGESVTLTLAERASMTLLVFGSGRVMEGTIQIRGTSISRPIHRGDSIIEFTGVPAGMARGLIWIPADSPSVSYEIYGSFALNGGENSTLSIAGSGRWFNVPNAMKYDTVTAVVRDSRGRIWIGSHTKGLFQAVTLPAEPWKRVDPNNSDLNKIRTITVDHDTIYVLGSANLYRSVNGESLTDVSLPAGSGLPISMAAGDGTVVVLWNDRAVLKNSLGEIRSFNSVAQFSSVAYVGNGTFVVGTVGAGILQINQNNSAFITKNEGIPSDSILAISGFDGSIAIQTQSAFSIGSGSSWKTVRLSSAGFKNLLSPRTILFDSAKTFWAAGYQSSAIWAESIPSYAQDIRPGSSGPTPDFFSICSGFHHGIILGGIGGIIQMP